MGSKKGPDLCDLRSLGGDSLAAPDEEREDEDETLTEHLPGTGHSTEGAKSVRTIPV